MQIPTCKKKFNRWDIIWYSFWAAIFLFFLILGLLGWHLSGDYMYIFYGIGFYFGLFLAWRLAIFSMIMITKIMKLDKPKK